MSKFKTAAKILGLVTAGLVAAKLLAPGGEDTRRAISREASRMSEEIMDKYL